jgi:hypothetical protein
MSAAATTLPSLTLPSPPVKKKRVLLIDGSRVKRDLRSETMRKLGMDVDCAADISEARCWWRADLYDLVLMNVESTAPRDKFCADIRCATPPQQIMFLVGKPEYLAAVPNQDQLLPGEDEGPTPESSTDWKRMTVTNVPDLKRWGILEACRRISVVRSATDARARAIRDRPQPPRDSETSVRKRTQSDILAQLTVENAQ